MPAKKRPLRVVIVSEDSKSLQVVGAYVSSSPDLQLVGQCASPGEAGQILENRQPDVIVVDIAFTELTDAGPTVAPIRDVAVDAAVIVVADDDRDCVDAIEAGAVDYMVRPFNETRLGLAFERAVGSAAQAERSDAVAMQPGGQQPLQHLMVKRRHEFIFLSAEQVERIEAERNYVRLFCSGKSYQLRARMRDIEAVLDPGTFIRVHRSTIINVKLITALQRGYNGDYVVKLRSGAQARLTRSHSEVFFERFVIRPAQP
jgi:two-component system, LytTR family, response regulator AlgR